MYIGRFIVLVQSGINNQNNDNKGLLNYAFEAVPMYRRIASLPDEMNTGDVTKAMGMAALALINLPEDCRDVVGAAKQVKSIFTGEKYTGSYNYRELQHPFSFFRGTLLHKLVDPNTSKNPELATKLLKADKTFTDTRLGTKILSALGVKVVDKKGTKIETINSTKESPKYLEAKVFEGSGFGKITGRAMERTTALGLGVLTALEIPKLIKACSDGDNLQEKAGNTALQSIKSGINVAGITAGIAYGGAIGSKYGKGLGSLVGMGAGAIIGSVASKTAQKMI